MGKKSTCATVNSRAEPWSPSLPRRKRGQGKDSTVRHRIPCAKQFASSRDYESPVESKSVASPTKSSGRFTHEWPRPCCQLEPCRPSPREGTDLTHVLSLQKQSCRFISPLSAPGFPHSGPGPAWSHCSLVLYSVSTALCQAAQEALGHCSRQQTWSLSWRTLSPGY